MSKRNIIAGLVAAFALIATPAFADGKDGTRINKGPQPLKARTCSDGTPGYYDSQGRFICQSRQVTTPRPTYTPPRTTRPAPQRTYTPTRISTPAPAPAPATFDLTGLTGGVGANVTGGYYGGGGGLIINDRASFSGVLSHSAAALTFNRRRGPTHRPMPPRRPMGCGCGGMGGGMGGGD